MWGGIHMDPTNSIIIFKSGDGRRTGGGNE
jgi:hypothetical protein